ncbi:MULTISPECIES: carbohydrate ABC transporter permease [unclassified Brachybacterium]|uniref:carbohydrate ABC transporter permease n=1 Tax=unclassified Brachybacterium TaxID=2623841 RepID=UPI00402AAF47
MSAAASATKEAPRRTRVNLVGTPALMVVLVLTQVPFAVTAVISLLNWNLRMPSAPISFAGADNYLFLLGDPDFYRVILNTVILTGASLVIAMVLAFVLANLFNNSFPGAVIARSILIIPYFVMEPVIGIIWKTLILSPTQGLNGAFSALLGIEPISFFSAQNSLATIVMLCVWQWTPFLFLIIISGLQSLPEEVMEAAQVDGAGWLRRILSFKIPLLRPYFLVAATFGLINLLKVFGIIFVTTQGGPGVSSANLPYYIYRTAFYDWQAGRASAISVVTVILTLAVLATMFRRQGNVLER